MLLLLGRQWAKSLFRCPLEVKVGPLMEYFPDTMRRFVRGKHDAIILDDIRDCKFFIRHQDKLQGKYDSLVEFASTPGGQCAYSHDLFAIPIVATINYATANRDLLETDDWLGNAGNRVLLTWPRPQNDENDA